MKPTPKLLAAITTSGAILTLGVCAPGQASTQPELTLGTDTKPLSARVEDLRKKLLSSSRGLTEASPEGKIDNIVQFFNFSKR
jgi:hypothetical protein